MDPPDDDAVDLYERAPCGYLSTAPDGTIVRVNATFEVLTGRNRDELVGRRFTDLLTAGGRIYHETHVAPMLHAVGSVSQIALEVVTADGGRTPVLVNAALDRDAGGAPTLVRAAVFDNTERRAYERELIRAKDRAEASEARARLLVRTLQQTLIPPSSPSIEGLDIAATYRPAGDGADVGGDFYDVFEIGDDDWIVVVGDVTGKGVEAAMITALARYTIRAAAIRTHDPRQILDTLNVALRRDDTNRLCTVAVARLTRRHGVWEVVTCHGGHPITVLARRGGPPVELGEPGTLLGAFDEPTLHLARTQLAEGDAVVLYTDGVTEGRRGREQFGEDRLLASLRQHAGSANGLTYGLLDDLLEFQGGPTTDDVVIVTVHVLPPAGTG
ncbi:MAG: SpoIIE family protein phosphatase [Ilumatobacteraceae bacterium]